MDFEQFYPTPESLGAKVAELIQKPQPPILEPSAGTGNLIQAFSKGKFEWSNPRFEEKDFHCVELNHQRAAFLKDKGYPVVWNDFLTFDPLTPYQTIIMNPPFHDGAKHLLKALNILYDGGEIACILNAETIKNPFSRERQELIRQLEDLNYSCEFFQSAFDGTDVAVALIYVKKPESTARCVTFENFKKSVVEERKQTEQLGLTRFGEINRLVDDYRAEVKSALHLFDEIQNYNELCCHERFNEIFEIKLKSHGRGRVGIVKAINYNYWCRLLHSHELDRLLTNDAVQKYSSKLREMQEYEFNERNILQLKADLTKNLFESIDDAIMKVWHNFTSRFSLSEYSKNIHYYNGWKTNKAFRCNKKVIIPLYAYDAWSKDINWSHVCANLPDIEKAMNYLDNGRTDGSDMAERLWAAKEKGITAKIDTKYFIVTVYKKNTCHLTFKDLDLLKKFNLYCGRKLNWLPDDYGFKPYESLDEDERAVADSFEGRESYQQTFANRQFYLQSSSPLMLTGGNNGKDNS